MSESSYTPSSVLINERPLLWNNASLSSAANLRRNVVLPPVEILLLPEIHHMRTCQIENIKIMNDVVRRKFSTFAESIPKILLMNEGSEINHCFGTLMPPDVARSRSIIEHLPEEITDLNQFSKFILWVPLMEPDLRAPNGEPINSEFLTERLMYDGYINLMRKVKAGKLIHQLIKVGLEGKKAFKNKIYKEILRLLSESEVVEPQVRTLSRQLFDDESMLEAIKEQIIVIRDTAFFEKLKARIAKEPDVRLVIWMPGIVHYNSVIKLIQDTPGFVLHANSATSKFHKSFHSSRRRRSQRRGTRRHSRAKSSRT